MAIEYDFTFNYSDKEKLASYLQGMPYFEKYDEDDFAFVFQKSGSKYPDAVIKIHETGINLTDYLTGIGRELIGLLVEYITGQYGELIIDEAD